MLSPSSITQAILYEYYESQLSGNKVLRLDTENSENWNDLGHPLTEVDMESGAIVGTKVAILDAIDSANESKTGEKVEIDGDSPIVPLPIFAAEITGEAKVVAITLEIDMGAFKGLYAGDIVLLKLLNDGETPAELGRGSTARPNLATPSSS
jgi:hypothetical protein